MDEAYFSFEFNELDKSMLTGPSNRRTHLITYNRTADRNLSHLNHDARQARPTISNSGPAKTRTSENKRNADGNLNHFVRQARPTTGNSDPSGPRSHLNARARSESGNRWHLNQGLRQPQPTRGNPDIQGTTHDHKSQSNSKYRGTARDRYRCMGFIILEKIANSNTSDIFLALNEHKEGFMDLLNSPIHRFDMIVLIFEILSKVSQSPFEAMKSKLFLDVCNSNFIACLRNYLTDLPYTVDKSKNSMYWNNQNNFWKNYITFCQDIVNISPTTAIRTCRALIESVSKTCLEYLNTRHAFVLLEEDALRFQELRNKLINYADKPLTEVNRNGVDMLVGDVDVKPPDDFRELSVIPTREDLLDAQPFVRPNIVNGAYSDVEHYLDVQFRLLREDCFGPIRVGINQYLSNPTKRKYDHVRIIRNVKFVGPYISNFKMGTLVQIDIENNKHFKKINWSHSKRLLFGSLVLFTKDNFSNVIVATILERDNILLSTGKLAISIVDTSYGSNIRNDDSYTMIESEVYFEPYLHVLKALQAPTFSKQLPMQEYIVKVNPSTDTPAYLTNDIQYTIIEETDDEEGFPFRITPEIKFTVLNPASWPTKDELKFNKSQYEAYKLALTHEFAVIQGPPGTGKTYVGLNIAKALLQNIDSADQCLMLVICYTNHALDQFLVEISKVTNKIVRIGGQSRNKDVDQFNLMNLRKAELMRTSKASNYYSEIKGVLKQSVRDLQESLLLLDILNHGVINHNLMSDVPQVQLLCDYYDKHYPNVKDPLMDWLFENKHKYYSDFNTCLMKYENFSIGDHDNDCNDMRTDYNKILEEDKNFDLEHAKKQMASFMLMDSKLTLKKLVGDYITNQTGQKQMEIAELNSKINLYSDMMKHRSREIDLRLTTETDFSKIAPKLRWQIYFMWIKNLVNITKRRIADFENKVSPLVATYEEARMVMDMELLKKKKIKVLGLTTSGAARMRKLLNAVSPKIVIVEEAAEVLEQHIITSLTNSCQHLILIGDHQQLRPSAAYLKLARQYNIEVSLFERMITNGIHSRRLNIQHRMRPEIAALISPHIYPELENHPSVENFRDVPGLEKSVFFFSHESREEEDSSDSNSRANYKEADLTLSLANYIMQQGYKSHEVTILTAYSGQMFYMRKERQKYSCLKDVKITVVDNYQGEESRIILLSLVRNNPDNIIGFLGTENRICVALSRAKEGFYMFGNINMLKTKSELWRKIAATLESNGSLGTVLNLKCQVHPDNITPIVTTEDFHKVPEGGCLRKCNYMYTCGHRCVLYCHGYDRGHVETKCFEPCERVLCDLGHVCPLKCSMDCGECKVYVRKKLPCGHEMDVFCHREPEDPKNKCLTIIEDILPKCGHKVQKACHMNIQEVKCTEKCKQRLDCGHACERNCHVSYPDHKDYVCYKACTKKNKGCTAESLDDLGEHQCKKACHEECNDCNVQVTKKRISCKHKALIACCVNIEDTPCKKKCSRKMDCGHFCMKKCSEPCGNCTTMVVKVIPDCNHEIKVQCQVVVSRAHCTGTCERTLACGHRCTAACSAVCDVKKCKTLVSIEVDSPCGHKVKLPCNVYAAFIRGEIQPMKFLEYCESPCEKELACKHLCGGSCSKCYQGRLHAPCKQTCNQMNICGHQCQEPCNQICPPCNMICEVQCQHSRCARMCGQPCVECQEKCNRTCPHGSCTRLCSETCSRAPCAEACARELACGHRCRGVCGEPCPAVCRTCSPDTFPTDFLGDEYGEDEKFILLEDCGHVLELENMDNLMMGNQEDIKIRQCPFCRKPIINTKRYKDLVNNMFRNDINPIKRRIYGKNTEINTKLTQLLTKVSSLNLEHAGLKKTLEELILFLRPKKQMYLLQVEMLLIYYDVIEMVTESWKNFQKVKPSTLEEELEERIRIILKVLKIDSKSKVPIKISEQQQKDIGNEIKRLNAIVQLAPLLKIWRDKKDDPNLEHYVNAAKNEVLTTFVFNEDKAIETLTILKTKIKASVHVSKLEREMIVRAVGLKAGHWFKCPNGHYYCIDRCGGATVIGRCPDCGDAVGGTKHKLLASNRHAPEMDGSDYPAYSVEANNMANFLMEF
ncbi:unnamed protein product [Arctia plantaginis]|uniref:RZ-type domain-containing protein n=1 Tax=Arctia plantaginis TaxID=874455 RepID=A0A8S1BNM7_ARCPL|nr:unnamed protein product [Arctia plantaginis]